MDNDSEILEDSKEEELKRADHMLYVTLKYTRTVDVIKNIIKRLISALDFAVADALKKLKIKSAKIPQLRFKQLITKIPKLKPYSIFYLMLRKIDKAKFTGKEEYRKNVSLITKDVTVTVETLKEYFAKTKEFVTLLKNL